MRVSALRRPWFCRIAYSAYPQEATAPGGTADEAPRFLRYGVDCLIESLHLGTTAEDVEEPPRINFFPSFSPFPHTASQASR